MTIAVSQPAASWLIGVLAVGLATPLAAAGATAAVPATAVSAEQAQIDVIAQVVPAFVFIGGGSGVLISADGYLLTNHHVAGSSRRWRVRVGTKAYQADVVGNDPRGDITLLKLRDATGMPYVDLADSDRLFVGQRVIAVGNPFAAADIDGEPTVTQGVVSALHRVQNSYTDAIQTDAPINPGNSGGPLLTLDGRLAGINGQIAPRYGASANTGIGYAIPANQIRRFLPLLREAKGGRVYHGLIRGIDAERSESDGIRNGAEIKAVVAESAAAKAGLRAGDRITAVDGLPVLHFERLVGLVSSYPGAAQVQLTVDRAGKSEQLSVILESLNPGAFGFQPKRRAMPRTPRRDDLEKALSDPVVIDHLMPGLAAENAGLKVGDQVTVLAGVPIANLRDWIQRGRSMGQMLAGDRVSVTVRRSVDGKVEEHTVELVLNSVFDQPDTRE